MLPVESPLCMGLPGAEGGCLKAHEPTIHDTLATCLWHSEAWLLTKEPWLDIVLECQ